MSNKTSSMDITGVIIPTLLEASVVLDSLTHSALSTIQSKPFYKGTIQGQGIVLTISGIGKANASHAAALLIERFAPALIINIGVAGAYPSSGLEIGDIAIAETEVYADEGLITSSSSFVSMESLNLPLCACNNKTYFNSYQMFVPEFIDIKRGVFLTVSTCTGSYEKALSMERLHKGICENMEGAAIAQTAAYCNVPCVEIRAVSNIIRDRSSAGGIDMIDLKRAAKAAQDYLLHNILRCPNWLVSFNPIKAVHNPLAD